ncbi:MAG: NAD(P)/FAD-dependent oxidoreductase [Lachnospiraceae bacterium]|nr:NAD(P)/FAD-dependent oxidoreductase [Lachnospiraceae bacterium]
MKTVIITGGGASGMAAAFGASEKARVILLEQNEKLGKKLYITGKGRCNLTNAADTETQLQNVVTNRRFLYSALYSFSNTDLMALMEGSGLPLKTERGGRVFPASDHSSDVIRTWERLLKSRNVEIRLGTRVTEILTENGCVTGVRAKCGGREEILSCDALVLATGGLSYRSTGATGDGYRFSEALGHTVTRRRPALCPLTVKESFVSDLQGLSLKNVGIRILGSKKALYEDFGELLFTHFGVSGPVILSASSIVGKEFEKAPELTLLIDLKPALTEEQLDARILRDLQENLNKKFRNALGKLLPQRLIGTVIEQSGIDPEKPVNEVTREERKALLSVLKGLPLTLTGLHGYDDAVITQGGVNVKEVNASTMESRLIKNLYFAGELLDVDAMTGGFNLQIAWSTGVLAGRSIGEKEETDGV